jgi:hypothetical protein
MRIQERLFVSSLCQRKFGTMRLFLMSCLFVLPLFSNAVAAQPDSSARPGGSRLRDQ